MQHTCLSVRTFVSIFVMLSAVAACSPAQEDAADDATGVLPDESAAAALETGAFPMQDAGSSANEEVDSTDSVPSDCTLRRSSMAFRAGKTLGAGWVRWVWRRYRCCDKVEKFTDVLMAFVERIEQRAATEKEAARCRHLGIEEGILESVDKVQLQCDADCYAKGEAKGAVEAQSYCESVMAAAGQLEVTPWTRKAVGLCGFAYELGCDAKFLGATSTHTSDLGACAPYTSDPYAELWNQSRSKVCDYYQR